MFPTIVLAGSIVGFAGFMVYLRDTLFRGTKPNRVSWLVWSIAPLTSFGASWEAGVRWAAVPTFIAGFGALLVFIASLASRNAYWKLGPLDYACGAFAFLALVLWAITSDPSLAIGLSIGTSALGTVPTIFKEWRSPQTETLFAYVGGLVSGLSAFTAVTAWNFPSVAFPSYMVAISVTLIVPLVRERRTRPRTHGVPGPRAPTQSSPGESSQPLGSRSTSLG